MEKKLIQTISPTHTLYRETVLSGIHLLGDSAQARARLAPYAEALMVLWHLDLEPCRAVLQSCRAPKPHGSRPWDPVLLLRGLLLSSLVGISALNAWGKQLRGDPILQLLLGLTGHDGGVATTPSIGTFYGFMARLHDGPRAHAGIERPSTLERRRSREPRHRNQPDARRQSKSEAHKTQRQGQDTAAQTTLGLVKLLHERRPGQRPEHLHKRLSELLWRSGVRESARRGLLQAPRGLALVGDGTPLPTAANGHGKRVCLCKRSAQCDCPRHWPDPDATRGYDAYRSLYFFGYNLYEIGGLTPDGSHLPLMLRLNPNNRVDHLASVDALEDLGKLLRDDHPGLIEPRFYVADCGHDSQANHEHIRSWALRPIIPLRGKTPAQHPTRDLLLSERAVPLCQAKVELASWGTRRENCAQFICPVKAKKLDRCPLAPPTDPGWLCEPETATGPVVAIPVDDDPRLFPVVPRNAPAFARLYSQRSSCERSNSIKKQALGLQACRHQRLSFWAIRAFGCAQLQHARVWVKDIDAAVWLRDLCQLSCSQAV